MTSALSAGLSGTPASYVLGRKLDSIPFSPYHVAVILVLGLAAFVEGYDLALTGSLLVLAKKPLHLTPGDIRFLAVAPTLMYVVGGFVCAVVSDRVSRKTILQISVVLVTFVTLLIPLVHSFEQLIILRLITGFGVGFSGAAPFPIAAELMPAQHRRTSAAIFEIMLAGANTLLPFIALLLTHNPNAFRLIALPGGLALFVVPVLIYFLIPQSPRWLLRRGEAQVAVDCVNRIIVRCRGRVPRLSVAALGMNLEMTREQLPPFTALFRSGQLRWTVVGILCLFCASTGYYMMGILLPKALIDQGAAISLSFGLSSLVFLASIPGKAFTGYLMEVIGRRWTITYALAGSLPGLLLMATAHLAGSAATMLMSVGAVITGFTVLSAAPATRMYLSEQFPTALRGRGHAFGETSARLFSGVAVPFLLVPYTGSPTIFFGTIVVVVAFGAFLPLLFGRETIGQLETVTEEVPELA